MKIGIDFDNTIAKYDKLFVDVALSEGFIGEELGGYDKTALRDHLRKQPYGETSWMKLQGLVYGQHMVGAELMPGVTRFLMKCKLRRYQVFVVSHKTEFGHFDSNNVPLRKEAMKWMTDKRFFDSDYLDLKKTNVFFADNRKDKVAKLAELQCDYFIDDLAEVFANHGFPANTRKILFSNNHKVIADQIADFVNDWQGIDDYIFGCTSIADVSMWFTMLFNLSVNRVDEVPRGGNSNIYKIYASDGNEYATKVYPDRSDDRRSRLTTEYRAIEFLQSNGVNNIPKAIIGDENLGLGIYSWINGISVEKPDFHDLQDAIGFIQKLHHLSRFSQNEDIGAATEACLSANHLVEQVENRLDNLLLVSSEQPSLQFFLTEEFVPIWKRLKEHSLESWPNSTRCDDLRYDYQVLSPSDFGFHNALKQCNELSFVDFEYFGWDDPVKLTVDFIWHPAMNLKDADVLHWEESMIEIFSLDPEFEIRLCAAKPLYGMRWAMIVLNKFLPGFKVSRGIALETYAGYSESVLEQQLIKAKYYCKAVMEYYPQIAVT